MKKTTEDRKKEYATEKKLTQKKPYVSVSPKTGADQSGLNGVDEQRRNGRAVKLSMTS